MTPDLKKEQAEVFELLQRAGGNCFLRMDQSDDALWVTDFPRRSKQHQAMLELLERNGIICCADETNGLWHLDWSVKRWEEIAKDLPQKIPSIPIRERYHDAYALCRLWMHSENVKDFRPARRLLKLMTQHEEKLLRAITAMHENAAAALRSGEQGACMAGRILAAWLIEKEMQI